MGNIISFEYLKRTIDYCRKLGLELRKKFERDPYEVLSNCASAKDRISEDESLSLNDKTGIERIVDYFADLAQQKFNEYGYGL